MTRGHPAPAEHAVVFGAGGIGTFLTFALAQLGADVLVADANPTVCGPPRIWVLLTSYRRSKQPSWSTTVRRS